jgi:hypothetical protein
MRLAVAFGASTRAVWLHGPVVNPAGFTVLLWIMAGLATLTFFVVTWLPGRAGAKDPTPR